MTTFGTVGKCMEN